MSYRNKTYVAFASEDIHRYRMMEAWRDNDRIDFGFFDAHDLFVARDTSRPETIVWQNNGRAADQSIAHVHIHIAGTLDEGGTQRGPVPEGSLAEAEGVADRLRPHLQSADTGPGLARSSSRFSMSSRLPCS
jgi:hypothetical protein